MFRNRDELISMLFRETDRAQRMKTALAVILCSIQGWRTLKSSLNEQALAELEREISDRVLRVLRCYDTAGWCGDEEFAVLLPGCNSFNAVTMAERFRSAVFGSEFRMDTEDLRLSACFGVAGNGGRSPLVVLRNAENALQSANERGSGAIQRCSYDVEPDPATLVMPILLAEGRRW
jgi:two-component system cell cycle response regulator